MSIAQTLEALSKESPRWTLSRKRDILSLIDSEKLSYEDAEKRYGLTEEEILLWKARSDAGVDAFMATKAQSFRNAPRTKGSRAMKGMVRKKRA